MKESLTRSRMDSFSDGVLAVIITIMVLELKVPPLHQMSDRAALLSNGKIFGVYLLSFVQVGIYWVNHHYLLDDLETVSHGILWANLALLFTLSLMPFGVQWIGERGLAPVPVAIYCACFCLPAIAWAVLASIIRRRTKVPPAAGAAKQAFSAVVTFSSVFVAFKSPAAALTMMALVSVIWLVPPKRIVEKTREAAQRSAESAHSS